MPFGQNRTLNTVKYARPPPPWGLVRILRWGSLLYINYIPRWKFSSKPLVDSPCFDLTVGCFAVGFLPWDQFFLEVFLTKMMTQLLTLANMKTISAAFIPEILRWGSLLYINYIPRWKFSSKPLVDSPCFDLTVGCFAVGFLPWDQFFLEVFLTKMMTQLLTLANMKTISAAFIGSEEHS